MGDPVAGPDLPQPFADKDFDGSLFFAREFIDCGPASGAVDAMSCAWLAGMLVQMSRRILCPVFGICMLKRTEDHASLCTAFTSNKAPI